MIDITNLNRLTCLLGRWLSLTLMVFMLTGCITTNYGRFKQSSEVEKIFASDQVLSDHKYYYTGSKTNPSAIMGIHQDYTLDDEFWDKAKDIQTEIKAWIKWMRSKNTVWGYYILAPDGKKIGIFYSNMDPGYVKMKENNKVEITLPSSRSGPPGHGSGGNGK